MSGQQLVPIGGRDRSGLYVKKKEAWRMDVTVPTEVVYPSGKRETRVEAHRFTNPPLEVAAMPEAKALLDRGESLKATLEETYRPGSFKDYLTTCRRNLLEMAGMLVGGIILSPFIFVGAAIASMFLLAPAAIITGGPVDGAAGYLIGGLTAGAIVSLPFAMQASPMPKLVSGEVRQETGSGSEPKLIFTPTSKTEEYQIGEPILLGTVPQPAPPECFSLPLDVASKEPELVEVGQP